MNNLLHKQRGGAEIELIVWLPFSFFLVWFLVDLNLYIYTQNQAQTLASDMVKILSNADNPKLDDAINQERWLNLAKSQLSDTTQQKNLGLNIGLSDKAQIQSWQMGNCDISPNISTTDALFPSRKTYEKKRHLWWVSVCLKPKAGLLSQSIITFIWPETIIANSVFLARGNL